MEEIIAVARARGNHADTVARLHGSANLRPGGHASHFRGGTVTPYGAEYRSPADRTAFENPDSCATWSQQRGSSPPSSWWVAPSWDFALTDTTHSFQLDKPADGPWVPRKQV